MRIKSCRLTLCLLLATTFLLLSPRKALSSLEIGDQVAFGDSLIELEQKLASYCASTTEIVVENPRFPLASFNELHLVCTGYREGDMAIGKIAFTVADGRFQHMEAVQVDLDAARARLGNSIGDVLGIEIFDSGTRWLNTPAQSLIWVSPEGRHLNLFAWHNFFLDDEGYSYEQDEMGMPRVADFTRPLSASTQLIEQSCAPLLINKQERVWLPNNPAVQVQADCFNYLFAGFPRKLELVYGDDELKVVWVLTAKPEEQRIRQLLIETWGEPTIENDIWEVYFEGRISLRKDKPELLFLAEDMIPLYMEEFNEGN